MIIARGADKEQKQVFEQKVGKSASMQVCKLPICRLSPPRVKKSWKMGSGKRKEDSFSYLFHGRVKKQLIDFQIYFDYDEEAWKVSVNSDYLEKSLSSGTVKAIEDGKMQFEIELFLNNSGSANIKKNILEQLEKEGRNPTIYFDMGKGVGPKPIDLIITAFDG